MNENNQSAAKDAIEILHSVQDNSPGNAVRIFFCEKRASDKYRTFMPQVSDELQKRILSLVLPPLIKSLGLPVVQYNPVGVLDEENELIIPSQVLRLSLLQLHCLLTGGFSLMRCSSSWWEYSS